MVNIVKLSFGITGFLLMYNYFLYPFILFLHNKIFRSNSSLSNDHNFFPEVTLVISAHNEDKVLEDKLRNSIDLQYLEDKFEILVVSDASTDRTDEIVKQWSEKDHRIKLIRQEKHYGKSMGLNRAVEEAKGEIIVFSDANAIYDKNAIQELVWPFKNSGVGFVVGNAKYYDNNENPASVNECLYWKYETMLKELESNFHSLCVGDGAIYAIRRTLYQNLEADDIGDFANPLIIASRGYLGIFNNRAVCYEYAAEDFQKEFSRKRRIVNRSWRAYRKYIKLFSIRKHCKFMFELFSHKILRWFNWLLLLILFVSNLLVVLLSGGKFYKIFFMFQIIFGLLAFLGSVLIKQKRALPIWIYFPYYFLLVNVAACLGIIDELRGEKYVTWEHVRET